MPLAIIVSIKPTMAQYFGVLFCLKKTPPNIITMPQTAVIIIAFIITPIQRWAGLFYFSYLNLVIISITVSFVRLNNGCGYIPVKNIATTTMLKTTCSFTEISLMVSVNELAWP